MAWDEVRMIRRVGGSAAAEGLGLVCQEEGNPCCLSSLLAPTQKAAAAAQIVWDYHHMQHSLEGDWDGVIWSPVAAARGIA